MIVIVCVDDTGGTMFNYRRQSQDQVLRERILNLTQGTKLHVSPYTAKQFAETEQNRLLISQDKFIPLKGEYFFFEGQPLSEFEAELERVILVRWNRIYPADEYLNFPLAFKGWCLKECIEFAGYSHEKISMEIYEM